MYIDMHVHCKPISGCARVYDKEFPQLYKNANIDACVLTNHCYPDHLGPLSSDKKEQAKIYVECFNGCKEIGKQIGLKVFFGCEMKLINEPNKPEFLLYGLKEEDFLENLELYNATQKELFEFCEKKDILMVQAHPFRSEQGYVPADMLYMHGVEIFNGHPLFASKIEDGIKLAKDNNKIMTCGSDFHRPEQAGCAGMIISDDIIDQFMLRDYIKTHPPKIFYKSEIFEIL